MVWMLLDQKAAPLIIEHQELKHEHDVLYYAQLKNDHKPEQLELI